MPPHSEIRSVCARLIGEPSLQLDVPFARRRRIYRPLVVGPVLIRRAGPAARWTVRVSNDGRLMPAATAGVAALLGRMQSCRAVGIVHRVGAALVAPQDLTDPAPRPIARDGKTRSEFYGWSLMYQFPGMRNRAFVDCHERLGDLPAFFESPLELIDRATFLAARGIASRPIALITQPGDFAIDADGRPRNRFYPEQRFRYPGTLDWLC